MGAEDADSSQCQSQSVSASVPCQSASSYGLVPFVAAQQPTGTAGQVSSTAGPLMLAQSAASHTPPQNVQVQPSVAASPLPHVQVIQQPLQSPYLQQLYQQPQHMFLQPGGNLTLQPSPLQGISLQLQQGKDGKILSSPMHTVGSFGTQSLIPAGNQMATAAKACVPGQMLATSSKSTVIQGQSGFIPATTSNQTVVIGQLGVLSNPQSVMPHQGKAMSDGQKGKSYLISQPATLHPKSPILPNPNVSCAGQMIATSQLKQLPNAPHIITTQAPTMITNQAQLLGSLQALGVPPGITWATPGSLHSSALFGQNPIFIRSQQSDMFIQSPPPQTIHTVPVQSQLQQQQQVQQQLQQQQIQQQQVQQQQIQQQQQQQIQQQQQQTPPALPPPPSTPQPQPIKAKPQPLRPGSSVATQTTVSTSSSSTNASLSKAQGKSRSRNIHFRGVSVHTAQSQTATTQTQTQPPPSQKADAANQTKPTTSEPKLASIYNKILATETSFSPLPPEPLEPPEVVPVAPPVMEQQQPILQTLPVPDIAVVAPSPVNVIPAVTQVEEDELEEEEEAQATMEMEVQTPMESLPQSLPPLPLEIVAPNSRSEVATEVDNIGIVVPMPEVVALKEKQPQKAIVKPQVLTHIIEGFVIQEGSEPFPVTIPSYSLPAKEEVVDKSMEPFSGTQTADISVSKKKDKIPKIRSGPVELAKCEFCGKLGPKAKFKRSKRFCSTSCAKRFNAGYSSKRLAIILPEQDQKPGEEIRKHKKKGSSKKGGKSKKKKQGLKSKKSWKKSENKLYEDKEWNIHLVPDIQGEAIPEDKPETPEPQMSEMASMETEDSPIVNIASDDESPAPSESADAIEEDEEPGNISNAEYATKSPLKWTVTDVVEFIRDLPGCSDYADEFRSQEIDGQALLLLKEDHLMSLMSMKLGPALKVCAKINSMRNAVSH